MIDRFPARHRVAGRVTQRGFTLIEVAIALLLGLLVIGAASAIFISNKRIYDTTESLGRIQETSRVAFELMSRDIREAGGNPCSSGAVLVNQLTEGGNAWWTAFAAGIRGYGDAEAVPALATGAGVGQRVAGTEAIEVHRSIGLDVRVTAHGLPEDPLSVTGVAGIADGDVLMVCNMDIAMIFQTTGAPAGNALQRSGPPSLNCADEFRFLVDCDAAPSMTSGYCFAPPAGPVPARCSRFGASPAEVASPRSVRWYIGNNARGGRSLYRSEVANESDSATPDQVLSTVEVAEGVEDLEVTYLLNGGAYTAPAAVADWTLVTSARIRLRVEATEGALVARQIEGTDGERLGRWMTNVVNLRNREGTL